MITTSDWSPRQTDDGSRVIQPESLAAKLAAVAYPDLSGQIAKTPRLVELLWFVQNTSTQPGGLVQFADDLLEKFPNQIGTPEMLKIGKPRGGRYSIDQAHKIWLELPQDLRIKIYLGEPNNWKDFLEVDDWGIAPDKDVQKAKWTAALRFPDKDFLGASPAVFYQSCKDVAHDQIVEFLFSLCTFDSIRCFQDIFGAIFKVMDLWASEKSKGLAQTEVARKVFDALDYAYSEKVLVKIEGDTRFGKTEAITTYCAMHPGRVRLVKVPSSNCDADLFRAIADAFGIGYTLKTSRQKIKETVEYVLKFGRIMILLDEAHYMYPLRFSENTPPMRLNWVRDKIIDEKVPCVLVSTPQSYRQAEDKYVRKTGYALQQFSGRIALSVQLPTDLSHEDLMAVARIHFSEFDEDYLDLIAGTAMVSDSYLQAVENISRRARFIAKREGRGKIGIADVDLAISEVMPSFVPAQTKAAKSKPVQTPKTSPATPLQPVFRGAEKPGISAVTPSAGELDQAPNRISGRAETPSLNNGDRVRRFDADLVPG